MRSLSLWCVVLVAGLVMAPVALAGVYSTVEAGGKVDEDYRIFREFLVPLRQMSGELEKTAVTKTAAETPTHKRYKLVADLFQQNPAAKLTDEERLNVGTYLLRTSKFSAASKALDPRQFKDRSNFLAYATLATNDYLWGVTQNIPGKLQNAVTNLEFALQLWPKDWNKLPEEKQKWFRDIGWKQEHYEWYRSCEEYQLKLFRLRRLPSKGPLGEDVEPLFVKDGKPVRFVGSDGNYQPGGMATAEKDKLPPKALEIVEQLLLWMPNDDRLYWLLGELLNAQGDVEFALKIFREIGDKHKFFLDLFQLFGPTAVPEKLVQENQGKYPAVMFKHIEALRKKQQHPESNPPVPPEHPRPQDPPRPVDRSKPPEVKDEPIDLRTLGVGFGFGLIVAFFGYWQYHEDPPPSPIDGVVNCKGTTLRCKRQDGSKGGGCMQGNAEGCQPLVIGWKEFVQLPDLDVRHLKAKIDTGARTSVLDVASYDLCEVPGRGLVAELRLALDRRHPQRLTVVTAPVRRLVTVSNSGGSREQRPLIETTLQLGPVRKRITLTVTNRASMRFRMLLGRKALEDDFLVDVRQKYLLRSHK